MSCDATTASCIARSEQCERSTDSAKWLSFPFVSFLLSALFNFFFTLYTLCTATSLCILIYQLATARSTATDGTSTATEDSSVPATDKALMAAIVFSLLFDLLYFSLRLHNRAKSAHSRMTYAAYFREKPASLLRLWGRSPHHRRLFFRWYAALGWMTALDVLAVCVCVIPVQATAKPVEMYVWSPLDRPLDVYHQILSIMSTVLEMVVLLECVVEGCRRCCGPQHPNVMVWHPQTGSLTAIHPHQYQEALLQQQQQQGGTPPHAGGGGGSFASLDDHPVHPPPAYGHQDMEDAYIVPSHPHPYMAHQYGQPQQHQQLPYSHQQPYMQPPMQFAPPHQLYAQQQQQPYVQQPYSEQVEGEEQVEGRPRQVKVNHSKVELQVEGKVDGEVEEERGEGEGGELGAVTAPLVMMMSPALMDDDSGAAAGASASGPRVMLRVRPSDADRLEEHNSRSQALSSPRYAVVHMSST